VESGCGKWKVDVESGAVPDLTLVYNVFTVDSSCQAVLDLYDPLNLNVCSISAVT